MMSSKAVGCGLVSLAAVATTPDAAASEFYGRLYAGPAYLHNDTPSGGDSGGPGIASELDLGARLAPWFRLHSSFIADYSQWLAFDAQTSTWGEYEGSIYGLGVGVTLSRDALSVGLSTGAQLTFFPGLDDPSSGPDGAGIGPFISAIAGYVVPVSGLLELGVHGLARYRSGKDDGDPSGYQLGLVLSVGVAGEPAPSTTATREEAKEPPRHGAEHEPYPEPEQPGLGAVSAQAGWWNAELELLTSSGVYVALGGPWVGVLLGILDDRRIIPFGARIGYQHELSPAWKLRAAAHLVGLYGSAGQCLDCASDEPGTNSWQLFELGVRHDPGAGLVYGIDVPLLVVNDVLDADNERGEQEQFFLPPVSLAFLQVYVGYSWPF